MCAAPDRPRLVPIAEPPDRRRRPAMTLSQLVQRHYDEVNTDDYRDAAEIFSPDVVTRPPGVGELHGIEAFVAYGHGFHRAFPDGRIHGDRYVESGDTVVVEGRF